MTRIDDAVDQILKKELHLTRAEAIKVVIEKREKNRIKKQYETKIKRAKERRKKGKPAKGSIKTVSGGAVSPR